MLGLTVALLLNEDTLKFLPAFLQAMKESCRVKVLMEFARHLQTFLPISDVSEWIAKNWQHVTVPILKLAEKLCSKVQEVALQASNILHISQVVYLDSSNLDEFITRAHFMLENEGLTIPNHLKTMEKQP